MSALQTTPIEALSRWEDEGGALPHELVRDTYDAYEHQALALLADRTVAQLKDDYREAYGRQDSDPDASEARRIITIELLRRLPREEVVAFEATVLLEVGREDVARRVYGDEAVDRVIADDLGITVAQLRTPGALDGINGFETSR